MYYAVGGAGDAAVGTVAIAMVGVHALIGIGEGVITGATVGAVLATRPDLVYGARDLRPSLVDRIRPRPQGVWHERPTQLESWIFTIGGLLLALALAFFVSPFASSSPDGLERVAIDQGFDGQAQDHALAGGPLADYAVVGVESESLSTGLSGIVGVVLCFAIAAAVLVGVRAARRTSRGASSHR